LIWSASSPFGQLQESLNTIWEVAPDPNAGVLATIKRRFLSMTMVLGVGFVPLVSLVVTAGVSAVRAFFGNLLPGGAFLWQIVNSCLSFAVITLLFAAIYKVLPDVTVAWSDVWIGSAVTALLFTVGKLIIGLYLGHASIGSTFGAAGSLLVFLVWVYYSAQILFFGAEFTQVYARRFGSRIVPAEGAVALTEEGRAAGDGCARDRRARVSGTIRGRAGRVEAVPIRRHRHHRRTDARTLWACRRKPYWRGGGPQRLCGPQWGRPEHSATTWGLRRHEGRAEYGQEADVGGGRLRLGSRRSAGGTPRQRRDLAGRLPRGPANQERLSSLQAVIW
jgi:hypothetical protein